VPYFHVVFTLPAELRRVVRAHQKTLLPVLFRAALDSLAALSADSKFLGGQIGALAVLHTWTRTLEWHPHLHVLVPGGALAPNGRTWIPLKARNKRFLVPVKALAKHFRGRFLHLARRKLPSGTLPQIPWQKPWVVFAKPAVQGADAVLMYLARYVHRTAITDKAIVASDDASVSFAYRDSRDQTRKRMTLPAHEFLRRFLQHVPAQGLHSVRAYGLLHPAHRATLRRLQLLLAADPTASAERKTVRRARCCPRCHQEGVVLLRRLAPDECVAWSARATLLDSAQARAPPTHPLPLAMSSIPT
jgi:hypothetical protein